MGFNFAGKTVVVTGGGGVLCGAFAKKLASEGAKVAVLDLNLEAATRVCDEITAQGGLSKPFECNVLEPESVEATDETIYKIFGAADILINGAGGNHPSGATSNEYLTQEALDNPALTSFFDLKPEGFNFVFNLNIMGTLIPSQVFAKRMIGNHSASIINMSSMSAFKPLTKVAAYSAAKAAVSNFTQWMAIHMAKEGIRVNAIAPGFFRTTQNEALLYNPDGSLTDRSRKILANTPMGRFGVPDDLLGVLMFLCDKDMSAFVTGTVIPVDGGFDAYAGV